ncbi:MAG: hypothetical protein MJ085_02180 [Clostridia bacterium]|nr:hypothetical protein [Clostridia bacterium]
MQLKRMNPVLFWILSCTWGILTTTIGALISLFLLITGHKPKKFGWCVCFEAGEHWGGCSFGPFFLTQHGASDSLKSHEHGHSLQNCVFGPFMMLFVNLPSTVRYHARNISTRLHPEKELPDYDAIWFEGQATRIGERFVHRKPHHVPAVCANHTEELQSNPANFPETTVDFNG